jgi:hypothetical protein
MALVSAAIPLLAIGGCERARSTPLEPSPPDTLTGRWVGEISDSSGPAQTTWQIVRTGASIAGTVTFIDVATEFQARGTVAGTLEGTQLRFQVHVATGAFDSPFSNCTADILGDASVTPAAIDGTYGGDNSCTGPITAGQLSLTKSP